MEIPQHITIVGQEAKLLAEAAELSGLEADVPACPGWNVRDLVRHLGEIHLWAAAHVAQPHDKPWVDDVDELTAFWPDLAVFWPDDSDLITWYLETNANLVRSLESAPADVDAFTFLEAPTPLAMWARRQAHETAVHRFDAQDAAGIPSGFDPAFASDGVDELLVAFAQRKETWPVDDATTMLAHAEDTNDRWHLTLAPDGITTVRGDGPADLTLTGTASDLYLVMWNRIPDNRISAMGDLAVLDAWHGNHRVRWTT
jgi:uncharacterized protein (TIGR03083 family)